MQLPYFTRTLLLMTSGPIIWAFHFLFIYVVTALACARPSSAWRRVNQGMLQWVIGISTVLAIGAILLIVLRGLKSGGVRENMRFVEWSALALGIFSFYAILLQALPVLLVPACA